MELRVTQYGEPILRRKGEGVTQFDDALKSLARDMMDTMSAHEGTGLAAQQVGKALLLFVIDLRWHPGLNQMPYSIDGRHPPLDVQMPMAFVNGDLEVLPSDILIAEEGCLSFPEIRGDVPRGESVRIRYQNLDGVPHVMEAGDWLARVLQHEFDHTQGVLFVDHMDDRTLRSLDAKLKKLKRSARQRD